MGAIKKLKERMTKICSNFTTNIYTHTVSRKSVKGHMKDRRKIANHIIVRLPKISEIDTTTKSRERKDMSRHVTQGNNDENNGKFLLVKTTVKNMEGHLQSPKRIINGNFPLYCKYVLKKNMK